MKGREKEGERSRERVIETGREGEGERVDERETEGVRERDSEEGRRESWRGREKDRE